MQRLLALAIFATLSIATTVHAQPGLTPRAEPGGGDTRDADDDDVVTSYRAITLSVDGAAIGVTLASFAAEGPDGRDTQLSSTLLPIGMIGSMVAVPVIHVVRGHVLRGVGSLALRGGLATVGMMAGMMTASCSSNELLCGYDRLGPGMLVGVAAASLIDAAFLTDEHHPREAAARAWTPVLAPRQGGGTVGFAAAF